MRNDVFLLKKLIFSCKDHFFMQRIRLNNAFIGTFYNHISWTFCSTQRNGAKTSKATFCRKEF